MVFQPGRGVADYCEAFPGHQYPGLRLSQLRSSSVRRFIFYFLCFVLLVVPKIIFGLLYFQLSFFFSFFFDGLFLVVKGVDLSSLRSRCVAAQLHCWSVLGEDTSRSNLF